MNIKKLLLNHPFLFYTSLNFIELFLLINIYLFFQIGKRENACSLPRFESSDE